jgi:dUTP pyrophosphatase
MKPFSCLYLWVDNSIPGLLDLYTQHVEKHNKEMVTSKFPNSGFDLFSGSNTGIPVGVARSSYIKFGVHAEMKDSNLNSCAYYLMPRSSFSKTPLLQSNSIGLIDSGYRGEIMAPVRNLSIEPYTVSADTRLFQLVHPNAEPFIVQIVTNLDELSSTERGDGGFGSTGITGTKKSV